MGRACEDRVRSHECREGSSAAFVIPSSPSSTCTAQPPEQTCAPAALSDLAELDQGRGITMPYGTNKSITFAFRSLGEIRRDPCVFSVQRTSGEVSRGEKMALRGTDPGSYITEHTFAYQENNHHLVRA